MSKKTYPITIASSLWGDMSSAIESCDCDLTPTFNPPGLADMITAYYVAARMHTHYQTPERIAEYLAALGGDALPEAANGNRYRLVLPSLDAVRELREVVLYRTEFNAPRRSNRYGNYNPLPSVYLAGIRALDAIDEILEGE